MNFDPLLGLTFAVAYPDSHVAYIVLTFELARTKSIPVLFCACEFKGQYYTVYATRGRVWERG